MNDYYGPNVYRSDRMPTLTRKADDLMSPWFNQTFDMRLPWGLTEEVAPHSYMADYSPKILREIEKKPNNFDGIEFHQRINQEKYRHATPASRTKILLIAGEVGKFAFWILLPLVLLAKIIIYTQLPSEETVLAYLVGSWRLEAAFLAPPLIIWLMGSLILTFFLRWCIKPSKGPKWELNRRTGMVTLFHYDKKGQRGTTDEQERESAPFYEFNACLTNEMIPPGQVVHTLYLVHRYGKEMILPIGSLIGKTRGEECFALWDMFQNFMDTSRPLPDIPLWEEFRPQDPVTAEHDKTTNRPPRYWRDMDDKTWKQNESDMISKVLSLNTPSRPNMMRPKIKYKKLSRGATS